MSGGALSTFLEEPLATDEYIDFLDKKKVSAVEEEDIEVSGELKIPEAGECVIGSVAELSPDKIELSYFQDINKVLANIKASVTSLASGQTT